ncbi:two-component sensor histidine kinase [Spongiactinospora gelatinilytica]|uniref:histidine kinase n=1 Tax=Spongiactinospora gelatinilytica TaxID=2666298 RepID=A0A2W2FN82_9ACTN|nr:ATP-binding protein [Spongiactinospora gelatinilytica]PZG26740.1 two-component sensor histidine kinase [Spongiactinospora gelatinilytica]
MSARARIVGWMLLVVTLALAVSVFATWTLLHARMEERVNAELGNEAEKLGNYIKEASRAERDVERLLTGHLVVNAPDRHETFFTIVNGKKGRRTYVTPELDLSADDSLVAGLARATEPYAAWLETAAGTVRHAVIPVRSGADVGHFVIVVFYEHHSREVDESVRAVAVTAGVALLLAGAAGWWVAGRVLAPVRLVRQAAERINDSSDLTRRLHVPGNDDVAALAATFNRMLDRLERAFAVQRDFVDDAGHELRTPITVIRGHLELMGDDPQDRAETIALVTDELTRMNRIVDDLLTLAKAEQPGFLALDDVELADLTVTVLAKARPLGPRNWRVEEVADASIRADGQRLTQAMMQLIANAVRHTEPGDLVAAGSAVRGAEVVLWVRDSGPGVRAQDRERIFARFVRGGSRTHEGAGLGLAIVRSIAEAHGGQVHVESADGGGALFVITIPFHNARREPPDDVGDTIEIMLESR